MPTTYNDLIADVRRSVRVVSLEDLRRRLDQGERLTLVDVREKDEVRGGYIPGAINVPRGFLEMQIEQRVPDKGSKVVLYCAGGVRSAAQPASRAPARPAAPSTRAPRQRRKEG